MNAKRHVNSDSWTWLNFALIPFKAYTLIALVVILSYAQHSRDAESSTNAETVGLILLGYVICFVVLLVGGLAQAFKRKKHSVESLLFASVALVVAWFVAPGLSH